MTAPALRVQLQAAYGSQVVLDHIDFEIARGEILGLVGGSGAGKSTLVMAILGLLSWRGGKVSGQVVVDGENLLTMRDNAARRLRGKRIALVPQSPTSALNGVVSLRAHFDEAWRAHETSGKSALDVRLRELLPEVQLAFDRPFLARRASEISVGQAQRIMIALALLHRPAIVIADEPTSALDPVTQAEIVKLLRYVNRTLGTALLLISHDLISVLQLADRVAVLASGSIVECLSVDELEEGATHPYTRALLRSLPVSPRVLLAAREAEDRCPGIRHSFRADVTSDVHEPEELIAQVTTGSVTHG